MTTTLTKEEREKMEQADEAALMATWQDHSFGLSRYSTVENAWSEAIAAIMSCSDRVPAESNGAPLAYVTVIRVGATPADTTQLGVIVAPKWERAINSLLWKDRTGLED